jgi:hypothetical protein
VVSVPEYKSSVSVQNFAQFVLYKVKLDWTGLIVNS